MSKVLAIVIFTMLCCSASADSFRCGRKVIQTGDTVNALLKKCGEPDRTFQTTETVNNRGYTNVLYVTHHVYERGTKKDMIITVRDNVVTRIETD